MYCWIPSKGKKGIRDKKNISVGKIPTKRWKETAALLIAKFPLIKISFTNWNKFKKVIPSKPGWKDLWPGIYILFK